jgi:integrase
LSPFAKFTTALKSREVQRQYPISLGRFLDFCKFDGLDVEEKAVNFYDSVQSNSEEVEELLISFISFQKQRIEKKEITSGTLKNYLKAVKLFCKMNRIRIAWEIISPSLPKVKQYGNDRIPSLEEIKKLIEYPDSRIKLIVFMSISTGIRVGAWDFIQCKDITPLKNDKGEIIAAKLIVYPNEPEQYFTFMTPEAYNIIKEWMDFRSSFGEQITGESWILRNTWQKVKPRSPYKLSQKDTG